MECPLPRHADDDRRWRRALARRLSQAWRALRLGVAALLTLAATAHAQFPGAQRLDRGRFAVVHAPEDARLAETLLTSAVTRDTFPGLPRSTEKILIMLAPSAAAFREWAGATDLPWAAALALVEQRVVIMQGRSAGSDAGDPVQVLRHELAHVALYDHLNGVNPRWFDEGYASYAAGEERTEGFLATNSALLFRRMPTLAALDTMLASPRSTEARAGYALALRAVTDLASIDRRQGLAPLLAAWPERGSFDLALRRASALTADDFERDWQQRTRWQFAFLALATNSTFGVVVVLGALFPFYRARRARQRERLEEMRRREAITEEAMRSAAVDAMLGAIRPVGAPVEPDA